jgi:hypothetical protein
MDLSTGKFTAPRPGIYFFSFAGSAHLTSYWFWSQLYLNNNGIGTSAVNEDTGMSVNQFSSLTIQSTLNLKKGDQVWVQIHYSGSGSSLADYSGYTHFTGFMLEEEIVVSI